MWEESPAPSQQWHSRAGGAKDAHNHHSSSLSSLEDLSGQHWYLLLPPDNTERKGGGQPKAAALGPSTLNSVL